MPKTNKKANSKKMTPEQAAEKAKPKWRVVKAAATVREGGAKADGASPELKQLQKKYLGDTTTAASIQTDKKKGDLDIVLMEEKNPVDVRVGRKSVIVDGNKVIGEQG
jgi:hypothetical protein